MTTEANRTGSASRTHRDYYKALYQAVLTISSSLEVDQVLQSIVKSTAEAMEVKACGLRLFDPETGQLHLSAVYGLSEGYLAKGPVNISYSLIDSETLKGTNVYIADARTDARFQYKEAAREEGIVSVLCTPLEVHGKTIGVIRVYTGQFTEFHEDDVEFLTGLANLAALAIENARLYESVRNSYQGVVAAFWGSNEVIL